VTPAFWFVLFMVTLYAILAGCFGAAALYFLRRATA